MRDRLVMRHPKPKPKDEWFMLDRWTPREMHHVSTVYREVTSDGVVTERVYRTVCWCGWRSIEFHQPVEEECPVGAVLFDRARRIRKDGERIIWIQRGV